MPPLARPILLVLLLALAGCDVIYDRPEIDFSTDFGAPYEVVLGDAVQGSAPAPPFVASDRHLVVDVAYRSGCAASRFSVHARRRDAQTAEVWLLHRAAEGSCTSGSMAERRLTMPLPDAVAETPRLLLLLPDRTAVALGRVY